MHYASYDVAEGYSEAYLKRNACTKTDTIVHQTSN